MFAHCHGIASKIRKWGFGLVAIFIAAGGVVFAGFLLGVGFVVLVTLGPSRALALDAMILFLPYWTTGIRSALVLPRLLIK